MVTEPLTQDDLRRLAVTVLDRYHLPLDEFLAADVDDLATDELRDLWLMVKGALLAA